ncbi:J immobilization antigen, putative (macronuclear) [Tetrahymena thermophila SB210]|uniref:J immobilization antigen, putative n=1 Tax=Tetrahymena thermophila (strain SB210) TaxID=312017 RepID=Q23UH6_TETTS|nr:J immobilization antigen, putative [Tetrahymena thermophila SB210]EAS00182.1 J immobilization antigen, putative [Tetrahymena thermophila SB210]|eukprot:XP_001020427.1 J immobilization antigen, putative [Tetrahymena thermophila SB210]
MKYILAVQIILLCTFSVVLAADLVVGNSVACGNGSNCSTCGSQINPNLYLAFTYISGSDCQYKNCNSLVPKAFPIDTWVCKSCAGTSTILGNGIYVDTSNNMCVGSCPSGQYADDSTNNLCTNIPVTPGNSVACSTDGSTCSGCGSTSALQNQFTYVSGNNCKVTDCTVSGSGASGVAVNGWICQSCNGIKNSGVAAGAQFNGSTCVASCDAGKVANAANNWTCTQAAAPGNSVACSTDGSTCSGCGSTTGVQNLFTHVSGNNCRVADCTAGGAGASGITPNGWICNSCNGITGTAVGAGAQLNGSTCSASCPTGYYANAATGWSCTQIPSGNPVACSTDGSTCSGCGSTTAVQNLFKYVSGNNCKVADCGVNGAGASGQTPNGWICNSCNGVAGSKVAAGNLLNGSSCSAACSDGQTATAASNWVCQAGNQGTASTTNKNLLAVILVLQFISFIL